MDLPKASKSLTQTEGNYITFYFDFIPGNFKSLGEIIANDLSESEREALKDHVMNAISNVGAIDAVKVVGLILNNDDVRSIALNAIKSFATERMGLTIVD